jgi:hypothetical protein
MTIKERAIKKYVVNMQLEINAKSKQEAMEQVYQALNRRAFRHMPFRHSVNLPVEAQVNPFKETTWEDWKKALEQLTSEMNPKAEPAATGAAVPIN